MFGTNAHGETFRQPGRTVGKLQLNPAIGRLGHQRARGVGMDREEIHRRRADEAGDEAAGRTGIDFLRRTDLFDDTGIEHHHAVSQGHRLDLVVRDIKAGGFQALVQQFKLNAHLDAQLGVEVGEWFVKEKHRRFAHDGAAHGHPLALAAGELARFAFEQLGQAKNDRHLINLFVDQLGGHPGNLQAVAHVLAHRHMRIQGVVLEHHGDIALRRFEAVDHLSADDDFALGDAFQSGDHAQQR